MKVGIVGSGNVGAGAANAMVLRGVAREIVMVDINTKRAQAEAEDILHAVPFSSHAVVVRQGEYSDLAGCQVVVITAGVAQRPGETRLQLLERNAVIFRGMIPQIVASAPDAILVIATNPVDIMTHLAAHYATPLGTPRNHVIGSGTTLDTARFRSILGRALDVDPEHVHGYVVGEHGDTEVLAWSMTTVGTVPLEDYAQARGIALTDDLLEEVDDGVRRAAYRIIEGKGSTYYGIGAALARIVQAIVRDQRSLLTVSVPVESIGDVRDITFALPAIVGGDGIIAVLPKPLNDREQMLLEESARTLRQALDELAAAGGM
ncbi:MAG TPA: L-lactate dehydrogenase [Anaerolineae bacterium]|nr:L-lactate dehydrogenase [Anaerolineae bacterium]HNU02541.1 L-lactate dehydrogenase [Anaerolineae bacterium]